MPAPAHCERVSAALPPHDAHDAHDVHDAHDARRLWGALEATTADDDLPLDPRLWSRGEVGAWAARRGARAERFPMNGKALCLMTCDMFAAREPRLGQRLHHVSTSPRLPLPADPRLWSRGEVGAWAARRGARAERFPMNGKALCLMTCDMFAAREPRLGQRLHHVSTSPRPSLPADPRLWSRGEVGAWAARRGARAERFPMNGKALCLMTCDMFAAREPRLGQRLHHVSTSPRPSLPADPRLWSRGEVGAWAARRGARAERFPMNGKALCLMTCDMFAAREPRLGQRLHHEFRRRLAKALALQELLEKLMAH